MTTNYRVGLLGRGIGQSLSPALHVREATRLGLAYDYRIIDLLDHGEVDLGAELTRLESEGFAATNVTHPFKQAVLDHVDELSDVVKQVGSANLVLLGDGRRIAHNTDALGFREALESFLGARPRTSVLQIGAGGAGLATVYALLHMGFECVVVHDIDERATDSLIDRFSTAFGGDRVLSSQGETRDWLPSVSGAVHVTPVGMREHPGVAFDVDLLPDTAWVSEVVYRPLETELLRRARARGLTTLDGGPMAVGQAVGSIRLITGHRPDTGRMLVDFNEIASSTDGRVEES